MNKLAFGKNFRLDRLNGKLPSNPIHYLPQKRRWMMTWHLSSQAGFIKVG